MTTITREDVKAFIELISIYQKGVDFLTEALNQGMDQ